MPTEWLLLQLYICRLRVQPQTSPSLYTTSIPVSCIHQPRLLDFRRHDCRSGTSRSPTTSCCCAFTDGPPNEGGTARALSSQVYVGAAEDFRQFWVCGTDSARLSALLILGYVETSDFLNAIRNSRNDMTNGLLVSLRDMGPWVRFVSL